MVTLITSFIQKTPRAAPFPPRKSGAPKAAFFAPPERETTPMESLSKLAALCSEITVILAALAMLIKPIRSKLLGLDKLTDALKCQLRHDMLHTYYRHREDHTIRQYELEDFLFLYRGYKALGGNSFIDRIKSEIDEWEVVS